MNVRHFAIATVALVATSGLFAEEAKPAPAQPQRETREQPVLRELAAGMRDVLRAVVPEISLPALELKLPTIDLVR